eukprot:363423-Chlamydomonas_euryale.AAC.10
MAVSSALWRTLSRAAPPLHRHRAAPIVSTPAETAKFSVYFVHAGACASARTMPAAAMRWLRSATLQPVHKSSSGSSAEAATVAVARLAPPPLLPPLCAAPPPITRRCCTSMSSLQ